MPAERTFIALKPDAIQQGLVGTILARFEDEGLTIQRLDTVAVSDELLAEHYAEHVDEPYYDGLVEYMQEQPVIAGRLAGENAVETVRQIIGYKNPVEAEPGTIRGDLGTDSFDEADAEGRAVRNLVHASATVAEAEQELDLWFGRNNDV